MRIHASRYGSMPRSGPMGIGDYFIPSMIVERAEALQQSYVAFQRSAEAAGIFTRDEIDFYKALRAFGDEWAQMYRDVVTATGPTGWAWLALNETRDRVNAFARRLTDLYARARSIKPALVSNASAPPDFEGGITKILKDMAAFVASATVLIGVAWIGKQVVDSARKPARSAT